MERLDERRFKRRQRLATALFLLLASSLALAQEDVITGADMEVMDNVPQTTEPAQTEAPAIKKDSAGGYETDRGTPLLTPITVMLAATVAAVFLVVIVVRQSRKLRRLESRVCSARGCRHINDPGALFCTKCGERL